MKLSYSRLSTYRQCPKKWYYHYVEELEEVPNANLIMGDLFHRLLEAHYTGADKEPLYEEFHDAIGRGALDMEKHLLEDTLNLYIEHYAKRDKAEKLLSIEKEMELPWENDDYLVGLADKVYEYKGLIIVRDTKTTFKPLKYTTDQVMFNPQFLLYAAMVEETMGVSVDAVEVDEVRIAELQKPKINKNGRPTADFNRLGLVTYERYYQTLVDLGLEDEPEYEAVLEKLKKRGHPLFRRIMMQVTDPNLPATIIDDLYSTYKQMRQIYDSEDLTYPRHRTRLCDWCGYQNLCNLDHFNPSAFDREMIINKDLVRKENEEEDEEEKEEKEEE